MKEKKLYTVISINIDAELKDILEIEAYNLNWSLSRYVEAILRERDIEKLLKNMSSRLGVEYQND